MWKTLHLQRMKYVHLTLLVLYTVYRQMFIQTSFSIKCWSTILHIFTNIFANFHNTFIIWTNLLWSQYGWDFDALWPNTCNIYGKIFLKISSMYNNRVTLLVTILRHYRKFLTIWWPNVFNMITVCNTFGHLYSCCTPVYIFYHIYV